MLYDDNELTDAVTSLWCPPWLHFTLIALSLSEDAPGGLNDTVKVGEEYGTFDECSERFSSAIINIRLLGSH